MVFDGLTADEEAIGDLGIGQPVAKEFENFAFAFGQQPASLLRRPRAYAEQP